MEHANNSELGLLRLVDHNMLAYTVAADSLTILRSGEPQFRESHEFGKCIYESLPIDAPLRPSPLLLGVDQYVAEIAACGWSENKPWSTGRHRD
jgi:hypothetical protein